MFFSTFLKAQAMKARVTNGTTLDFKTSESKGNNRQSATANWEREEMFADHTPGKGYYPGLIRNPDSSTTERQITQLRNGPRTCTDISPKKRRRPDTCGEALSTTNTRGNASHNHEESSAHLRTLPAGTGSSRAGGCRPLLWDSTSRTGRKCVLWES